MAFWLTVRRKIVAESDRRKSANHAGLRVLPQGFEFDGEVYRSLSAVARKVTGCLPPSIERLLRDANLPTNVRNQLALGNLDLRQPELLNDLLRRKPFASYLSDLL